MTPNECDTVIKWCRDKINEKNRSADFSKRLNGNRLEGYEMATKAVMSYFHYIKEEAENENNNRPER